ncbi:unnamed protein product [Mytilus coruscus]|uniref:DUF6570 domain-containing protein n=1 Tax=Mytilus coruscus TaxID=42192 RepID=A0A6J8EYV6_MYTCO|nr:unnamed protein product [Mytilus coruscus]
MDSCIKKFEEKTSDGPLFICTSCNQTWFSDSVVKAATIKQTHSQSFSNCLTDLQSVDNTEWICHTCQQSIRNNKIPRLSSANKMNFPEKPKELELYPMEERTISFMEMRELPRGGQLSVKENVVNVPEDIQPIINSLPRTLETTGTIPVKLKKKLAYKSCDFKENVTPTAVICDKAGDKIIDDSNNDNFSEIDENETHVGNNDTLLDFIDEEELVNNKEYMFAPREGQRPLSLYSDPDAEYLSFPSIFCGQRRADNKDRDVPVQYTDIVKWKLRSVNRQSAQSN